MATIRDVAEAANVSIATVSRVLNNKARVSEETAQRVWTAAAELDYWPNEAARSLTTHRTHVVGVLLPDLHGEFFSEVIRGIDQAAREARYQILVSSSHADHDEVMTAAKSMQGRIDGLIFMASDNGLAESVDRIQGRMPLVLVNPRRIVEGTASLRIGNFLGAREAVNHLLQLGHEDIAILKGPTGNIDAEERLRGYRHALAAADRDPGASREFLGDFQEPSGYRAAAEILGSRKRPTAVFACNDMMAIALISAFGGAGLKVPEDIAVVGFDDIAIARYINPPLTTVRVEAHQLGQRALRRLIAILSGDDANGAAEEVLPATLVVRESCGAHLAGRAAVPFRRGESPETIPGHPARDPEPEARGD